MRVVQVVHNFLGRERGGTERYTEELVRALDGRVDVEVFTSRIEDGASLRVEDAERDGVPVGVVVAPQARSLPERVGIQREVARRFEARLRARRPDLVHVQHAIDVSPGVLGVPARAGIPCLVSLHDFWYLCPRTFLVRKDLSACHTGPRGGLACVGHCRPAGDRHDYGDRPKPAVRPSDAAFVARALRHRRLLGRVDRFVAPSAFCRDTYAGLGLDPARIEVIPWGMPSERQDRGAGPAPRPPARSPVRFAFLGYVSAVKGADLAIEAFRDVGPARARLTLHGPVAVPEAGRFRALLATAPHVRTAGPYAAGELPAILSETDVVLVPSRARETFSRVVREAFGHGVPVVVSDAGALPEHVRDGVDGLVFRDPAGLQAVVERLASDPSLVDRLRAGIGPVHGLAAHAEEMASLYARVVRR